MRKIAESVRSGDRELSGIVEPWIEEAALSVHLEVRDEGVPVAQGAPCAGPRVLIEAGETVRIRNQRSTRNVRAGEHAVRDLLRIERLAVEEQLGVELARPPAQ